jgi:hypothetical protein
LNDSRGIGVLQEWPATEASQASGANSPARPRLNTLGGVLSEALIQNDVRIDKVAALRRAIAARTYRIPASDVAGGIISSLLR